MTFWLTLFGVSLVIRRLCTEKMKAQRVSRNAALTSGPRYEQDRPYPECFDDNEMEDDL